MIIEYSHQQPDTRVDSISGHYVIQKEEKLEHGGREFLVVYGYAVVEKSCCGSGAGWRFARVPGYVVEWHSGSGPEGVPVSKLETIESEREMEKIREIIDSREMYCQVNFD